MAVGALGALHRAGLSVPADVSLVGYDNSPLAAYDWVSLTTVDPDAATVGRSAGDALIDLIEGASSDAAMVLLEPRVVVRDSSGPVQ